MSWVLLDDNFPHHPKTHAAGRDAAWLYVCGLCYCRKFNTGGYIPIASLASLGAGVNPRRLAAALVTAGLWIIDERGGFQVHDYKGFYADEVDKAERQTNLSETRSKAGRLGVVAKQAKRANLSKHDQFASSTGGMVWSGDSDHLLEEKKREADFSNFWARYPKKDGKQAAMAEWMKLKPTDEQQKAMAADLDRRCRSAQWLKDGGQFIPHARTYLHQKRWEDGFEERPRLSERTVNVIKGFGADEEIA